MLSVLVCYEKAGWQKGIQSVLQRQSFVSASYLDLRSREVKMPLYHYDVIFVQAGRDKGTLRKNLLELRRKYATARFVLMLENLGVSDLTFGHRMGMSAFVDERATPEQIMGSIEAAARGDLYASSSVIRRSLAQPDPEEEPEDDVKTPVDLSHREIEVLNLVARGMSNRLIARNLFISEKTVKNHLYSIFRKIGVTDRTKAALFAVRSLGAHKNGSFGPAEVFFEVDEHH
ncbi:MAG: response regulator transcription factor [Bacillota bacterium]